MRNIGTLLISLCIVCVISINIPAQSSLEKGGGNAGLLGNVSDNVFRSPLFGFELDLPKGWTRMAEDDMETARNIGVEALKSTDSSANKAIDSALSINKTLLAYSKEPLGAINNAALEISAVKMPSKFVTAKMVIEGTKSTYLKNPSTKLLSDTKAETIGGRSFQSIEFEIEVLKKRVPLRIYVVIIKQHAISFALSYNDAEALKMQEDAVRSIRFN